MTPLANVRGVEPFGSNQMAPPRSPGEFIDTVGRPYGLVCGDLAATRTRRPGRPGNEFPGSSIGMSLRDSGPFANATSVLRPNDVPVPEGDIPMVEPGNSLILLANLM